MGVLTLYTTWMERGIFLNALQKDEAGIDKENQVTAASSLKRYDRSYSHDI